MALHKNARTTPAVRAEIASSTASAASLAQRFGITEATIYKWKKRTSFQDGSSPAHRLRTTLTPAQERVVVELRRHGVSNLNALKPATPRETHKSFKRHEPGCLHIGVKDLPQMADETQRRYLFVAMDRAARWVFVASQTLGIEYRPTKTTTHNPSRP